VQGVDVAEQRGAGLLSRVSPAGITCRTHKTLLISGTMP
jgi:hypothetical protein